MSATDVQSQAGCPAWCMRRHGSQDDETVHVSGALQVGRTILRLVVTADLASAVQDGPYVLVGEQEYTLHQAEVLIGSLTQLVDEARAATAPAVPRMRLPGH